jgi:hypothetical protein
MSTHGAGALTPLIWPSAEPKLRMLRFGNGARVS